MAATLGVRWLISQADLAVADAERRRGDHARARAALAAAKETVAAIGNVPQRADVDLVAAELDLSAGDGPGALDEVAAFERAPHSARSDVAAARASVVRARALLLRATGEDPAPLAAAAESAAASALETARTLAIPELVWRAAWARGAARALHGDARGALEDYVIGMETLRAVASELPRGFRAVYLADPDRLALKKAFEEASARQPKPGGPGLPKKQI
jgi:hypothetical protein